MNRERVRLCKKLVTIYTKGLMQDKIRSNPEMKKVFEHMLKFYAVQLSTHEKEKRKCARRKSNKQ